MSSPPRIRPFRHRLYIHAHPFARETKTKAGVIVTARARENEIETSIRAEVLAVGPDCHADFEPGVWILIPRFSGTAVIHDELGDPDARYLVISEDAVIAIIDPEEARQTLGLASR